MPNHTSYANRGRCSRVLLQLVVFASVLSLAACKSPMTANKDGSAGMANSAAAANTGGAQSQGVGDNAQFAGQDMNDRTRLMAPHNQTYHFDFDSNIVRQSAVPSIEAQARFLATHPAAKILLTGNTDNRGSREYNIALGERRAKSVADILRLDGVAANQIRIVSYGEERPVAMGDNESAWDQNRRVELIYEAKG